MSAAMLTVAGAVVLMASMAWDETASSATPLVHASHDGPHRSGQMEAGAVYQWGQVGDGASDTHSIADSPLLVPGLSGVTALSASNSDGYALTTGGTEWAWGYGAQGELGTSSKPASFESPVAVAFPTGTVIAAIGEAEDDGYAVDSDGGAWAWGRNSGGELCDGTSAQRNTPVSIALPSPARAVAGGATHVEWLTAAGTVYTCGQGSDGELGNGTLGNSDTPVAVSGLPKSDPVVAISAGNLTCAALTSSGELWMWGAGVDGALGDGSTANADVPVQVPGSWSQIYVGGSTGGNAHAVGLTVSGQVEAWGAGQSGELGNGKTSYSDVPVAVSMPPGVNVTAVMAGGFESGAVDAKGNVWMWGRDDDDQLGSGPKSSGTQLTPVEAASTRSGQRVQLILTGTASNVIVG